MEQQAKQIAQLLKILANENRLLILCELIEGAKSVGAIGLKVSGISQSALSQHLSILKAWGIVDFERSGQSMIYSIADDRVESVIAVLKEQYCRPEEVRG